MMQDILGFPYKLVSWLIAYLGNLQPAYIGVIVIDGYSPFTKYHGHPSTPENGRFKFKLQE